MTKAEPKKEIEPLPQINESRPERFAEVLASTKFYATLADGTRVEAWPNPDPRLTEAEVLPQR